MIFCYWLVCKVIQRILNTLNVKSDWWEWLLVAERSLVSVIALNYFNLFALCSSRKYQKFQGGEGGFKSTIFWRKVWCYIGISVGNGGGGFKCKNLPGEGGYGYFLKQHIKWKRLQPLQMNLYHNLIMKFIFSVFIMPIMLCILLFLNWNSINCMCWMEGLNKY